MLIYIGMPSPWPAGNSRVKNRDYFLQETMDQSGKVRVIDFGRSRIEFHGPGDRSRNCYDDGIKCRCMFNATPQSIESEFSHGQGDYKPGYSYRYPRFRLLAVRFVRHGAKRALLGGDQQQNARCAAPVLLRAGAQARDRRTDPELRRLLKP